MVELNKKAVEAAARLIAENHWSVDFDGSKSEYVDQHWIYHKDDAQCAITAYLPALQSKDEQIERLTRERDEALAAEDEAKDSFWAIYPDWVKMKGHGISTEAARTKLSERIGELEELLHNALAAGLPDEVANPIRAALKGQSNE